MVDRNILFERFHQVQFAKHELKSALPSNYKERKEALKQKYLNLLSAMDDHDEINLVTSNYFYSLQKGKLEDETPVVITAKLIHIDYTK